MMQLLMGIQAAGIEKKPIISSPAAVISNSMRFGLISQIGKIHHHHHHHHHHFDSMSSAGKPPIEKTEATAETPTEPAGGDSDTSSVNVSSGPAKDADYISAADLKAKRRTPGRKEKIIADLFLMAGRLPDAIAG